MELSLGTQLSAILNSFVCHAEETCTLFSAVQRYVTTPASGGLLLHELNSVNRV